MWIHEVDPLSLDAIADMSQAQLSPELIHAIAQTLRSAREERGDGYGEIALRIALTSSQLKAIEAGNLQPFYSPAYFLQAAQRYADFLGVALPSVEPAPDTPPTPDPDALPVTSEPAQPVDAHATSVIASTSEHSTPTDQPAIIEAPGVPQISTTEQPETQVEPPRASAEGPPAPQPAGPNEPPPVSDGPSESNTAVLPIESQPPSPPSSSSTPAARPGTVRAEVSQERGGLPWGWILLAAAALIVAFVAATSLRKPVPVPAASETPAGSQEAAPATPPSDAGNATGAPASPPAPAPTPAAPTPPANKSAAPSSTPSAGVPQGVPPATATPPAKAITPASPPAAPAQQPPPSAPPVPASKSQGSGSPAAPAPGVANPPTPGPSSAAPTSPAATRTSPSSDSQFETQAGTWVQIVRANGEKVNLKVEPGQKIDFAADSTAAIVFGQPEKASLRVKGKPVNLGPFLTGDSPPRALVIISQIRE